MKATRLLLFAILLFGTGTTAAWAQHHHYHHGGGRIGIYVGPVFGWAPYYYTPPYYYDPYPAASVIAIPSEPQTYIEQAQEPQPAPAQQQSSGYWYYCSKPDGYYPYVKKCPRGWQKVAPQPSQP